MEWHAADGSVMTQDQWNAQASGEEAADTAETGTSETGTAETDTPATDTPATIDEPAVAEPGEIPSTQGDGHDAAE
jgi:hypothetical protein